MSNSERDGSSPSGVTEVCSPDPMAQLLNRMDLLERENQSLKDQLASYPPHPPYQVTVKAPPPFIRLGIFTGLKPSGGSEIAFDEWCNRAQQIIQEEGDRDAFRRIKSSLRGIALEQIEEATTSFELISSLRAIYGSTATEEDKYAAFIKMQMARKEQPSNFFSRLWAAFADLNTNKAYDVHDAQRKIFHTFMNNGHLDKMLQVELRNEFGMPGSVSPPPARVLRRLRQLEIDVSVPSPATTVQSQVSTVSLSETDLETIVTRVTERLQNLPQLSSNYRLNTPPRLDTLRPTPRPDALRSTAPRPTAPRFTPRGPCFRCGEVGTHYRRECPNPPNPARVAAARREFHLNP